MSKTQDLKTIALWLRRELVCPHAASIVEQAAGEIERLTPKPMTLREACEVMTRVETGDEHWVPSRDGKRAYFYGDDPRWRLKTLSKREAVYVAQGLLRDTGPMHEPRESVRGHVEAGSRDE